MPTAAFGVGVYILMIVITPGEGQQIKLTILAIALTLVAAGLGSWLWVYARSSRRQSPAITEHALGLPKGSVRALLAFALVIAFVGLAVYFYRNPIEANGDFAKQVFTTVATILVTVIGFYFGSRGAAASSRNGDDPADSIKPKKSEIATMSGGELESKIAGKD